MARKRKGGKDSFTGWKKYVPLSKSEYLLGAGKGLFGYCSECGRRYDKTPLTSSVCAFC